MDFLEEDIILDWIAEHPSTVSEAAGKRPPCEWRMFLERDSRHCRVRGVSYLGHSRSLLYKYVQPETETSKFFSKFLNEEASLGGQVPGPSAEVVMSEFVPPNEEDLWKHLAGFGENSNFGGGPLQATVTDMLNELGRLERDRPKIQDWLNASNLTHVKVPAMTSPGIRWKKLGYKTKRAALMPAILEASRVLEALVSREQEYHVPPAGVAGRGKRVAMDRAEDSERKEGRLIVMPDLVRHLIGALASAPYMRMQRDLDKSNGGVMLGMGPFHSSYEKMAEWARGAKRYLFLDFKKFDQRIPRRVLRAVMLHLSQAFERCSGFGAYWESEFRHLVDTEIAMPDGSVYRKHQGVASGDPWTSLADSYANWVVLSLACKALGWDAKIWTFGDDSVIAVQGGEVGEDAVDVIAKWLSAEFGMVVSKEKSYSTDDLVGIEDDPEPGSYGSFLSNYFLATPMGIRPTRPLQDFYELFLKPERNRGTLEWEVVRTSMAYLIFYYNPAIRYLLHEYWDWLHHRYKVPELHGTLDDLRLLRELDIPWTHFRREWLTRLPHPGEVELLYKYGHSRYYPPLLWARFYSTSGDLPGGNDVLAFDEYSV